MRTAHGNAAVHERIDHVELEATRPRITDQLQSAARGVLASLTRARSRAKAKARLSWGIRACQLYFALTLACALGYALITAPADFAYDFSLTHGMFAAAGSLVVVWLFQKRSETAIPAGIGVACANVVFSVVDMFLLGAFDVVSARLGEAATFGFLAVQYVGAVAVIGYLALSLSARETLSAPSSHGPYAAHGHSWDVPMRQRVRTWVFWRDLAIYFIVFSFMGHWAEMLFCYNIHLGVFMGDVDFSEVMLWHQWLFPYCAEGVAVALIVVLMHPAKEALLKLFGGRKLPALLASIVVIAAICTTIDFTCGMICNQNYEVWDYRAIPFNFMGQVCLQNSSVYTVAATLIVWVFYPLMDRGLRRLPRGFADGLFFALLGIYAFSALLHFMFIGDAGLIVGAFEM